MHHAIAASQIKTRTHQGSDLYSTFPQTNYADEALLALPDAPSTQMVSLSDIARSNTMNTHECKYHYSEHT